jgi:hypothetical protein
MQIDAQIEHYISLKPFQFSLLRRFELKQAKECQTLVLDLENATETHQLTLTFESIHGLEFLPRGFQPIPLYLEVISIVDRQWEGVNYQVFNSEQDVKLPFYCRHFQARVQEIDHSDETVL